MRPLRPATAAPHAPRSRHSAYDDAEDAQLVELAIGGDRDAEEAIYRRHVSYVAGMVLRLLVDQVESEDVVQDTFALALRKLRRLRSLSSLRPWLAQIAVSQVHRRFRKLRLLRLIGLAGGDDPATLLDQIAAPDVGPEVRAELASLGRLLGELPAAEHLAWSLRYVEGATLDEVASACRCSLATAKRRVAAADARVRAVVRMAAGDLPMRFAHRRRSEVGS